MNLEWTPSEWRTQIENDAHGRKFSAHVARTFDGWIWSLIGMYPFVGGGHAQRLQKSGYTDTLDEAKRLVEKIIATAPTN